MGFLDLFYRHLSLPTAAYRRKKQYIYLHIDVRCRELRCHLTDHYLSMIRYPELLYQAVKVVPETFQLSAHEERELKVLITPKLVAPLEVSLMCEVKHGASRSLSVLAQVDGPKMKIVDAQVSPFVPTRARYTCVPLFSSPLPPSLSILVLLPTGPAIGLWSLGVCGLSLDLLCEQPFSLASANRNGVSAAGPCPVAG